MPSAVKLNDRPAFVDGGYACFLFQDDLMQRVGAHFPTLGSLLAGRAVAVVFNTRFIECAIRIKAAALQLKRMAPVQQAARDLELCQPVPTVTEPNALATTDAEQTRSLDGAEKRSV